MPSPLKWLILGCTGLALAFGVGLFASNLASKEIGLAGETLHAGEDLAPPERSEPPQERHRDRHQGQEGPGTLEPSPSTTLPPASTTTIPPAPAAAPTTQTTSPGGSGSAPEHEGPDD